MYVVLLFLLMSFFGNATIDLSQLPWDNSCHDGDELTIVKDFLPSSPVILEAGACGGEDTLNFIKEWPEATIHAFEPVAEFFERLKSNVGKYPNVYLYPFGLYSTTDQYPFYLCQGDTPGGASSLFPSAGLPECQYDERQIYIQCKNLDEWGHETGVDHIDYMWLDMEGSEYDALKGAPVLLQTVRVISCELNFKEFRKGMAQFEAVYSFLLSEGFVLYKIWGSPTWQGIGIFVRSDLLSNS